MRLGLSAGDVKPGGRFGSSEDDGSALDAAGGGVCGARRRPGLTGEGLCLPLRHVGSRRREPAGGWGPTCGGSPTAASPADPAACGTGGNTRSRSLNWRTVRRPSSHWARVLPIGMLTSVQFCSFHMISAQSGAVCAKVTMRRSQARRAASRLVEYTIRGPIAPSSQMSFSRGSLRPLSRTSTTTLVPTLRCRAITVATSSRSKMKTASPRIWPSTTLRAGMLLPTVDITPRFQRLRISVDSCS